MSKKSAVRAFGSMLAAAALVVAGVVGAVWARPSGANGQSVTAEFNTDVDFVSSLNWVVEPVMSIDKYASIDVVKEIGSSLSTNPGNVGVLKISTNGSHYDIQMSSKNGGKLATQGDSLWHKKSTSTCTWGWDCGTADSEWVAGTGSFLSYGSTLTASEYNTLKSTTAVNSIDSVGPTVYHVVLDVAIGGAFKNAANGLIYSVGCGPSGCDNAPTPVRVGKATVRGSNVTPVSFAEVIAGEDLGTNTKLAGVTIGGFTITGNAGTNNLADLSSGGFVGGTDKEGYIYINAGIHTSNSKHLVISANTRYTETLTFTLVNAF
ncbi:hypothetical protein R80B4_00037 [Fibrobacteres bacterium R8-0-B4]